MAETVRTAFRRDAELNDFEAELRPVGERLPPEHSRQAEAATAR